MRRGTRRWTFSLLRIHETREGGCNSRTPTHFLAPFTSLSRSRYISLTSFIFMHFLSPRVRFSHSLLQFATISENLRLTLHFFSSFFVLEEKPLYRSPYSSSRISWTSRFHVHPTLFSPSGSLRRSVSASRRASSIFLSTSCFFRKSLWRNTPGAYSFNFLPFFPFLIYFLYSFPVFSSISFLW